MKKSHRAARILLSMIILAASLVLSSLAEADPIVPRPFPCGMAATPRGQLKLVTIGGSRPYVPICSELHTISRQNIYEISMLRYHAKEGVKTPRGGSCESVPARLE